MKISQYLINWIAKKIKVPPIAVQMFKSANEISGVDKNTLPTELIPLSAIQLSRGLLNFTVLQSRLDWILPFWARKQYDPASKSFIPRSHMGLSMNITHRNWTAVGNMNCNNEPIVDPRGMVTPFKNGWSIDVWLITDGKILFASYCDDVKQELVESLPIVSTQFNFENIKLTLKTFTFGDLLMHQASIENESLNVKSCRLIFAIRPFNPEGISLINNIEYLQAERSFRINKKSKINFEANPSLIYCSSFSEGDSAEIFKSRKNGKSHTSVYCKDGLANAVAVFDYNLKPGEKFTVGSRCNLNDEAKNIEKAPCEADVIRYWDDLQSAGTVISTPDEKINSIFKSSLTTLLMLVDDDSITPGPFTYHQFWFRDSAYMIWALDRLGFSGFTRKIINSFRSYLSNSGYFRSQKGEWDSNGQALWTIFQHAKYSFDPEFLTSIFDSLFNAVKWIEYTRLKSEEFKDKEYYGLLPAGMSAEHLGLADYYFWDNAWSIAGLEAFIKMCNLLSRKDEKEFTEKVLKDYRHYFETAINNVQRKYGIKSIPASPVRGVDCGMIGSISVSYPLQIFGLDDPKIIATLKSLEEKYFFKGMFFQHYIHSGMNAYLTIQVAHAYLYAGDGRKFFEILSNALSHLSPTLNFPEAINPLTGGGCMGDGHHGWAAAEILLALNDAFVYEHENVVTGATDVMFLHGIPEHWFGSGNDFSIRHAIISTGIISLTVKSSEVGILILIEFDMKTKAGSDRWFLKLPIAMRIEESNPKIVSSLMNERNEMIIEIMPGNVELNLVSQMSKIF